MPTTRVTEIKNVKVACNCPINPVFLSWMNPQGGRSQWVFGWNQERSLQVTTGQTIERYFEDLETQDTDVDIIDNENQPFLVLGADLLDKDDVALIETLLTSVKVQMLVNPTTWQDEGPKWATVRVVADTWITGESQANLNNIEFQIMLLMINTQTQ